MELSACLEGSWLWWALTFWSERWCAMGLEILCCMAAKATAINLSRGAAPRPGIERGIKRSLPRRQALTSSRHSHQLGQSLHRDSRQRTGRPTCHLPVTQRRDCRLSQDGYRWRHTSHRQRCKESREAGGRTRQWRQGPVGMTSPRGIHLVQDRKGPQRQWLHKIGKAEDPSCLCGAAVQSGEHIIWHSNLHRYERRRNPIAEGSTWEDLDSKVWAPNDERGGGDDANQVDGVERFFEYLAYQF